MAREVAIVYCCVSLGAVNVTKHIVKHMDSYGQVGCNSLLLRHSGPGCYECSKTSGKT